MKPRFRLLDADNLSVIVEEAKKTLIEIGVTIGQPEIAARLLDHGAGHDSQTDRIRLTGDLIDRALTDAPDSISLYDVRGQRTHHLFGDRIHYTPGSSALRILDATSGVMRTPTTADYIAYVQVVSGLDALNAQSTAFIPGDVDQRVADSYRLFLSLLYGHKPVMTGIFESPSFVVMKRLLMAVRGSEDALKDKPLATFSCCPMSPLSWAEPAAQCIWDCAELGIPVELVPMPLAGFTAPVSLFGTLIQHAAENLSGLVISQTCRPGAPVVFGGSSAIFDMRFESTPMGAMESMMIACAANEVGTYLGLPTQSYIGLSDAKALDSQAGWETGMGAILGALSGINSMSGPGLMDFENCFCIEKLILDEGICRMAFRLLEGVVSRHDVPAQPLTRELLEEGHLLIADHTLQHLEQEHDYPRAVVDRMTHARWLEEGQPSMRQRLAEERHALEQAYGGPTISIDVQAALIDIMEHEAHRVGMDRLPERSC